MVMISWSTQKRLIYATCTAVFLALVVGIPAYFKFIEKPPSCFDSILNQDESQIDCGGVCLKICPDEAKPPIVLFERYFKVAPGVYNAVVLVENNNLGLYALRVPYVLKLYDADNALIAERFGETYLSASKTFPIIEYAIETNEREVTKVYFSFLGEIDWKRGAYKDPRVEVANKLLQDEESRPKLSAVLRNNEVYRIEEIPVVALLYDTEGNLMASSHTLVDEIAGKGEASVVFTWNAAFETPARIEVIPRLMPRELVR